MRLLVIGNAGAGKSTLGRKLAERHNAPFFTLDKIVWQEGWKKTPAEMQQQQIGELIRQESWVVDGVDYDVMRAADIVVFLDRPRRICFRQALNRSRKHLFASRPDLPPNCPEIRIIPTLVRIIWRFPKRVRPKILAEKSRRDAESFVHLRTNAEVQKYLRSL